MKNVQLQLTLDTPKIISIEQFKTNNWVKIEEALTKDSAELIYHNIAKQLDWNLVFNHQGKHQDLNAQAVATWSDSQKEDLQTLVNQQASTGFQYLYENIPLYDIYYDNLLPNHFFNQVMAFINQESTINFFRKLLSAPEISFADAQITRFRGGHFLNTHNDDVDNKNRIAAYVINLTPNWRPDWGGALHLLDQDNQITESFTPSFNEINIFKIPVDHYVGFVSPFAQESRISITGWLRSGDNPKKKR